MRYKKDPKLKQGLKLERGGLLILRGDTQTMWQHHVPKRQHAAGRINLAFRTLFKSSESCL